MVNQPMGQPVPGQEPQQPAQSRQLPKNGRQKYILLAGIVLIIAILVGGYFFWLNQADTEIVGGDEDAYGCIGSAGYSWCEAKNKCLRTWEEACENTAVNTEDWQMATLDLGVLGVSGTIEYQYPNNWTMSQNMQQQYLMSEDNQLQEEVLIHITPVKGGDIYEFIPPTAAGLVDPNPPIKTFGDNSFFYGEGKFEGQLDQAYEILSEDKSKGVRVTLIVRGGRQRMDYYLPESDIQPEMEILGKILQSIKFIN